MLCSCGMQDNILIIQPNAIDYVEIGLLFPQPSQLLLKHRNLGLSLCFYKLPITLIL